MKIRCVCGYYCLLALLGASPVLLSACGQYGDLYLPKKPSAAKPPAEQLPPQEPAVDEESTPPEMPSEPAADPLDDQ
jgi:Prokaryotic lipoprotein-attachment site